MDTCLIDLSERYCTSSKDWGIEPMYEVCKNELAFIWPTNKPKPPGPYDGQRGLDVECSAETITY